MRFLGSMLACAAVAGAQAHNLTCGCAAVDSDVGVARMYERGYRASAAHRARAGREPRATVETHFFVRSVKRACVPEHPLGAC